MEATEENLPGYHPDAELSPCSFGFSPPRPPVEAVRTRQRGPEGEKGHSQGPCGLGLGKVRAFVLTEAAGGVLGYKRKLSEMSVWWVLK